MSKQSKRRNRAKMIRAKSEKTDVIQFEANGVDWIKATEGEGESKPKRFSMTAYTGGPMMVGYYDEAVLVDLSGLQAKSPLPILMDHDPSKIVGHADAIDLGPSSLKLSGIISGASNEATQVAASAAQGFPWKASIGARPDNMEFIADGVKVDVNGRSFKGPLYLARKSTLGEVSFVALAADSKTSAKVAAKSTTRKEPTMGFQEWVKALGLDFDTLTDDQKAKLEAKYNAELEIKATQPGKDGDWSAQVVTVDAPAFDLSAVVLTYEKHMANVQASASKYVGKIEADKLAEIQASAQTKAAELKAEALNDEKPATWLEIQLVKAQSEAEVALIRAEMPKAPAIHGSTHDMSSEVIEAAFCRSAGLPDIEKHFKPETLEASDKLPGFGLQELLLHSAIQAGYRGRMHITQGNVREILQAAFSTHTVTTMLTNLGHKNLLAGYDVVPQTWKDVAVADTVSDFKTTTAFRMTVDLEYEELAPGGEIQHGELGQESYTKQAKTYAKMLALTRTDIINDDLGAFNDLRKRLGMGCALKVNSAFWTVWLAAANGAAFWTADRGNLVTSSAFDATGIGTAVKAFRNLAGPDGGKMNLNPDRVLVPPDLEATAMEFYTSREIRNTTASTKAGTNNIYANRFRPVVVPELSSSSYIGYSTTGWWMLPDPAILASASVCFLDGVQTPVIESADADFNTLGIQLRGYHDFGVQMTEYRATVSATA